MDEEPKSPLERQIEREKNELGINFRYFNELPGLEKLFFLAFIFALSIAWYQINILIEYWFYNIFSIKYCMAIVDKRN